jgi:RNA polymerase sigma-70 factor (ECF subfamily)
LSDGVTNGAEQRHQTADETQQRETLTRLYGRMGTPVFRWFRRQGCDPEEARELKQEVFLQVVQGLHRFQGRSAEVTWVFGIAKNVWSGHARAQQRHKRRGVVVPLERPTEDDRPGLDLEATDETPHQAAERSQETRLLRREIQKMPDPMRQCIRLYMDQGLHYREIATILHIPVGTAKSYVSRARQRLKEIFSNRPAKIPPEESP